MAERRPLPRTFLSLQHRDFRYLWTSTFFTSGGQWVQQVTVGWLVWDLSQSPFLVGLVGGLRTIPFLLVGPIAGVWADRYDRKRLLIGVEVAMGGAALLFGAIVFLKWVQVWHTALYMLFQGSAWAIMAPLRQSLVANTVPRSSLTNGIALQSLAFNVTRAIGPAVGGALIVAVGLAFNFLVQAVAYLVTALLVLPMGTPYRERSAARPHSVREGLQEGVQYVRGDRTLQVLIATAFIPSLFIMPAIQLMPVFTAQSLGKGPETLGLLLASFGIGAVVGAFALAMLGPGGRRGLATLLLLMGATLSLFLLSQAPWARLAVVAAVLVGLGDMGFRVTNNSLVQGLVPDALRGRVMSLYMMEFGFVSVASLSWGLVAQRLGISPGLALMAILGTGLVLLFLLRARRLRALA